MRKLGNSVMQWFKDSYSFNDEVYANGAILALSIFYVTLQYIFGAFFGRKSHKGFSSDSICVRVCHQGVFLPLLVAFSAYSSISPLAHLSIWDWSVLPSCRMSLEDKLPMCATIAYMLSDLTNFRDSGFNAGLVIHHMLAGLGGYLVITGLPIHANLMMLMGVMMEFGSLGINFSLLVPNTNTKILRYYLYLISRIVSFGMWAYVIYSLRLLATWTAVVCYSVCGMIFWLNNLELLFRLRKTLPKTSYNDKKRLRSVFGGVISSSKRKD